LKGFNEENVMLKRIEDENNLSNNLFSKKSREQIAIVYSKNDINFK
jgi:hypothetical protein